MDDRQENQVTMIYAVKELLDLNTVVWSGDAPFSASYALLNAQIAIIDVQRPLQLTNTSGAAIDKQTKRITLQDQTFFVANRIRSYAAANNNQTLLLTIKFTRSDLENARDTQLIGIAKLVKDTGTTNLAVLATYGITNAILTNLANANTSFQLVVSQPRVARTVPIAATGALATAIDTSMQLLKTRLDVDVEVFKPTNLTFYNEYQTARIIIDLASNKLALKCNVKDVNGNAIANVAAIIVGTTINKKTTAKGNFQLASLAPGNYTITFSKNGLQPISAAISVTAGETTIVNVVMLAV